MKSTMTETCSGVLRSRRNCSSDGAERTDDGRSFHARAVVAGKALLFSGLRRFVGLVRRGAGRRVGGANVRDNEYRSDASMNLGNNKVADNSRFVLVC